MPLLTGDSPTKAEPRELGWSAYRKGDWKVLRLPEPYGNGGWQLYNLASDSGELHDLSSDFPERTEELARAWQDYADKNGVIQPDAPTAYSKPIVGRKH